MHLGTGYHLAQSKISLGSGGLFGKGYMNGTQSQLDFLPENHTDFIFSAFGEEFGFIGVIILISLYVLVVLRGMSISIKATDNFSRILSATLILTIFLYVLVNVGMVVGILPIVGAPLPFMSYGGTSMLTVFAALGIIMSIKSHQRRFEEIMKYYVVLFLLLFTLDLPASNSYNSNIVNQFIDEMYEKHDYKKDNLKELFNQIKDRKKIKKIF